MALIGRIVVFFAGTIGNGILFLFFSRAVLLIIAIGEEVAGTGPGTAALNNLPIAMQLAIGGIQLVLIIYLLGGLGEERSTQRRPMP